MMGWKQDKLVPPGRGEGGGGTFGTSSEGDGLGSEHHVSVTDDVLPQPRQHAGAGVRHGDLPLLARTGRTGLDPLPLAGSPLGITPESRKGALPAGLSLCRCPVLAILWVLEGGGGINVRMSLRIVR